MLVFTRDPAGLLCAAADQHDLIAVHSKPLCDAIFDLYIGDQPVSKRAKRMTGEYFARLVGADEYCAPREPLVCNAAAPPASCEGGDDLAGMDCPSQCTQAAATAAPLPG